MVYGVLKIWDEEDAGEWYVSGIKPRVGWMWKPESAENDTPNRGDDELIDLSAGKDWIFFLLLLRWWWWCGERKRRDICFRATRPYDGIDRKSEWIYGSECLLIEAREPTNCCWIAWIVESKRWRTFPWRRATELRMDFRTERWFSHAIWTSHIEKVSHPWLYICMSGHFDVFLTPSGLKGTSEGT